MSCPADAGNGHAGPSPGRRFRAILARAQGGPHGSTPSSGSPRHQDVPAGLCAWGGAEQPGHRPGRPPRGDRCRAPRTRFDLRERGHVRGHAETGAHAVHAAEAARETADAADVPASPALARIAAADVPVPPPPLPRVITEGGQKAIQTAALAFAAHGAVPEPPARPAAREALSSPNAGANLASVPLPPVRPGLVAAKLDRSNFRSLTAPLPAARAQHSASMVQPLRSTLNSDSFDFATLAESGVASSFGKSPNGDLTAEAFTGPAIKPFATAGAYIEIPTGSIGKTTQ